MELRAGETATVSGVCATVTVIFCASSGRLGIRPGRQDRGRRDLADDEGTMTLRVGGELRRLDHAAASGVFVERTAD